MNPVNKTRILRDLLVKNLDVISEQEIMSLFIKKNKNSIKIMVAHRFYKFAHLADEIILLNKGIVIARGKHEELLLNNKAYRNLYNLQTEKDSEMKWQH